MPDVSWHDQAAGRVLPLQIIVAALVAGCVSLLVVFLSIAPPKPPAAADNPVAMLTLVAALFAGIAVIARLVVLATIASKGRRAILEGNFREFPGGTASIPPAAPPRPDRGPEQPGEPPGDAGNLMTLFHVRTIVGAAVLEGCAFFASIAYFLERNPLALGLAIFLILGVAAHFPTRSRMVGWVERQLQWLEQERQFAR